jgi:hypothetical protein
VSEPVHAGRVMAELLAKLAEAGCPRKRLFATMTFRQQNLYMRAERLRKSYSGLLREIDAGVDVSVPRVYTERELLSSANAARERTPKELHERAHPPTLKELQAEVYRLADEINSRSVGAGVKVSW